MQGKETEREEGQGISKEDHIQEGVYVRFNREGLMRRKNGGLYKEGTMGPKKGDVTTRNALGGQGASEDTRGLPVDG